MDAASEKRKRRLPEAGRPKRGTTVLPDGRQVVYDGDLTVLDKDGDVVSWVSSDLLAVLWGARKNRGAPGGAGGGGRGKQKQPQNNDFS